MSGKGANDGDEEEEKTNPDPPPIKDGQTFLIAPKDYEPIYTHGKQVAAPETMGKVAPSPSAPKTNTAASRGSVTKTGSGNVGADNSLTQNIQRNSSSSKSDTSRKSGDKSANNHSKKSKNKHSHKHTKKNSHSKKNSKSKPKTVEDDRSNSKTKIRTSPAMSGGNTKQTQATNAQRPNSKTKAHSNSASKGKDASKQTKQTPGDDCPTALLAPDDYVRIYRTGDSKQQKANIPAKALQTGGDGRPPDNNNDQAKGEAFPTALIAPDDYVRIYKAGDSKQQNGGQGQGWKGP